MTKLNIKSLSADAKNKLFDKYPELFKTQQKKSKYHSHKTYIDGYVFDSKKESDRYASLRNLERIGAIRFFIRQPKFDIGGGCTYSADFLVFWKDGSYTFEDVKGFQTKEFKLKKKIVESKYPVTIEIR